MSIVIILIIFFLPIACIIYYRKSNKRDLQRTFITRFRKRFKSKDRLRRKLRDEFSESLMADPDLDIKLSIWDRESDLREMADIHRARLNRYGRSRMNGDVLFMTTKGRIYKYTDEGEKRYL